MPKMPAFTDGWVIGKPDVVFNSGVDFKIPATGVVQYQYFKVDPGFKGVLSCPLHNISSEPITLQYKQPFGSVSSCIQLLNRRVLNRSTFTWYWIMVMSADAEVVAVAKDVSTFDAVSEPYAAKPEPDNWIPDEWRNQMEDTE